MSEHDIPLSEPAFLILLSLAGQPRHGYAILQDVEELSNNRVHLSTGTLYGAIRRLLEAGLIEPIEEEDAPRGRQAYRLTGTGGKLLTAEVDRMKILARIAAARLLAREA